MKITREELQAIENHIGNIPHVGAMYAPVLIAWCRALLDEQDAAYDERDELLVRVADQSAELRATREAYNGARADVPALIARVRELEAECERQSTLAAKTFNALIANDIAQMRAYGLSYEGVRKVLHEYNDGEISFGKLMDLIRGAARAMAEDMKK